MRKFYLLYFIENLILADLFSLLSNDFLLRRMRSTNFVYTEYQVTTQGLKAIPTREKINFSFPSFGTDQHQGVYFWLKEKIEKREIEPGLALINLDYHSDYETSQDSILSDATWLIWTKKEGMIGDIYWVRPEWGEYNPVPHPEEFEEPFALRTQDPAVLPQGDKLGQVILTLDFDYFSLQFASRSPNNKDKTQHRPSEEELNKSIGKLIEVIKKKRIKIRVLNLNFSPQYVWEEDIPRIKEKLLKAFQELP